MTPPTKTSSERQVGLQPQKKWSTELGTKTGTQIWKLG